MDTGPESTHEEKMRVPPSPGPEPPEGYSNMNIYMFFSRTYSTGPFFFFFFFFGGGGGGQYF